MIRMARPVGHSRHRTSGGIAANRSFHTLLNKRAGGVEQMGLINRTFSSGISVALRTAAILGFALLLAITARSQSGKFPRVWESPLTIQTYELGEPDPNPALLDWQRR